MPRKLRKDRVFRHMARDAPDYKILYVDSDELARWNEFPVWFQKAMSHWQRLMVIKHEGADFEFKHWQDYDIDFHRYRYGMEVRVAMLRGLRP